MAPEGAVAQPLQIGPQAPAALAPPLASPTEPTAATTDPVTAAPTPPPTTASLPPEPKPTPPSARGSWVIQIGAFSDEREARERLELARSRFSSVLAKADPYTEKTRKGSNTYFRARFAGLEEAAARRACNLLKQNDIACFAMKN
jgi:D-alanyl-D-alanine carboxypeptidase